MAERNIKFWSYQIVDLFSTKICNGNSIDTLQYTLAILLFMLYKPYVITEVITNTTAQTIKINIQALK